MNKNQGEGKRKQANAGKKDQVGGKQQQGNAGNKGQFEGKQQQGNVGDRGQVDSRHGSSRNQDQSDGMWDQIKSRARNAWNQLTDEDFEKANGSKDKLYGIIEKKTGDSRESIEKKLKTRNV